MDDDSASRVAAFRGLYALIARVSGVRTLDATLQAVVDGVVEDVGFGVAAINSLRADGRFEMRAVAGSAEAKAALLGNISAADTYDREFARADFWGALRFVPHERAGEGPQGWIPDVVVSDVEGSWHPHDALFAPLRSAGGELVGILSVDLPHDGRRPGALQRELLEMFAGQAGIAIDNARLTEEVQREQEQLRASEEVFRLAFEGSGIGMSMVSALPEDTGRFLRVNQAFSSMTGYSREELVSMRVDDLTHPEDLLAQTDAFDRAVSGHADGYRAQKRYVRADGAVIWVSVTTSIVRDSHGALLHGFSQVEDITARRLSELELAQAVLRDPLTGLLNRAGLLEHLALALDGFRDADHRGAVLFCDLDGFKKVNDTVGHEAGDLVLGAVAMRLAAQVRAGDAVARLGGDEFVVVLAAVTDEDLQPLVERIERTIAEPVTHRDGDLSVTVSIGISRLDRYTPDIETVLRQADAAMYRAKAAGRNGHAYHASAG